jgi:hypothetical protein
MTFRMYSDSIECLWQTLEAAGRHDATVKIDRRWFPRMLRRYLPPAPYSRKILFSKMLAGEPSLVRGFPIPVRGPLRHTPTQELGPAIVDWLAAMEDSESHCVYAGSAGVRRNLTVREMALKWRANRSPFGIIDLHIRHTAMEEIIDPGELTSFNILSRSSEGAREQEIFSFVISSRGFITDSHSDAPDSSNYCFTGKKLWLAWDSYEGTRHGLQDTARIAVFERAKFDIETWLTLRSARWFVVNPNETLFLPAHLAHKVITIEPYIGVGGFYLALPNCLRLLAHWIIRGPLWSKRDSTGETDGLVGEIAESVRDAVLNLRGASQSERQKWGYDYLEQSAIHFIRTCPPKQLSRLWADPRFRCVADVIPASWPLASNQQLKAAM